MPNEETESIEDSWKSVRPDRNTESEGDPVGNEAMGSPEDRVNPIGVTILPAEPYERSVIWVSFLWQGEEVGNRVRVPLPELTVSDPENHPDGEFEIEGEFHPPEDCYIDSINLYLCERGGPTADRNRNSTIVFRISRERGLLFAFRLRRGLIADQIRVLVLG